jgi:hypothetical protein
MQARPPHQRPRHGKHLLLPARQTARRQVALFLQDREHLRRHLPYPSRQPAIVLELECAKPQVFLDRQVGENLPPFRRLRETAL